ERISSNDLSVSTRRSLLALARRKNGSGSANCRRINAQTILRRIANPGLRINGAVKVIVQVCPLGHLQKQVAQLQRIGAGSIEVQRTELFKPRPAGWGFEVRLA